MISRLRRHQEEARDRARSIIAGVVTERLTVAGVTPGGGKSALYAIFANELLQAGFIDYVCIVTPRSSLAIQTAEGFLIDGLTRFRARRADNTPPFIRDQNLLCRAYTTTYQSIAAAPGQHLREMQRGGRYLTVLDEFHHLAEEEGRAWTDAVTPLVENSRHVLLGSGTITRWDGKRLPYCGYEDRGGQLFPKVHINYSRRDALRDQATLRVNFQVIDGEAEYKNRHGVHRQCEISNPPSRGETSQVLKTILGANHNYHDRVLRTGLDHWLSFRKARQYNSRALVLMKDVATARRVADLIKKEYPGIKVALAVSEDSDATPTLNKFRRKEYGDVLVTVGMAYEGLDVPDLTHLVCLTNIRSVPWLEQAFARPTRPDYAVIHIIPYAQQGAWIFIPADLNSKEIVEAFILEQELGLKEREEVEATVAPKGDPNPSAFQSLSAEVGASTFADNSGWFDKNTSRIIESLRAQHESLRAVSPADLKLVIESLQQPPPKSPAASTPTQPDLTQEEKRLRDACQKVANAIDSIKNRDFGATNAAHKRRWGKSRDAMGVTELQAALDALEAEKKEALAADPNLTV